HRQENNQALRLRKNRKRLQYTQQNDEARGFRSDGEKRRHWCRRALINIGHPDLKGHGGDLESERDEHEDETEERRVLFRCRISKRAREPLQVRLPVRVKNPSDSIDEKAGRERAEHEIFPPGFERDWIFPGKTNQN